MSMTNRLMAPVAVQDRQNEVVSVDLGAFLTRLILFETYVLQSVWFQDLELLSRSFVGDGLEQIFRSGILKVYCESYTIGQTGQARADLNFNDNNKRLPLCSYSFSAIRVSQPEKKQELELGKLSATLQEQVRQNLVVMREGFSSRVFEGFYGDIRSNPLVLQAAADIELRRLGIKPKHLKFRVDETHPQDFRVENSLRAEYGLSDNAAHKVIERALIAVGGLNQRFAEMMDHSALSGITDDDIPLLQGKLSVVADLVRASNNERRIDRVLTMAELTQPRFGEAVIDAEQVLKVRDSDECRAFRDWLSTSDSLSDADLKQRLTGLNARVRQLLNSKWGKRVRLVVSNGLGLLGPITGATASVVDSFILEKLAPRDSVLSFLGETYGSLFRTK